MLVKFVAELQSNGKTATGFEVPETVVEALGRGKRPLVVVTLNGHQYRSAIAPRGDRYLIGVSAENRALAGVAAGDVLEVDVVADDAPRVVEVPPDLAAALQENPAAAASYERLSDSRRQFYVNPIVQAKSEATRLRRVAKAIDDLAAIHQA